MFYYFESFFILIYFALGTCIGSFLGVVVDRLPAQAGLPFSKKLGKSRSLCLSCKKLLNFNDLIPLFSFLSLKGKCRYCKKNIGTSLLVIELIAGLAFVGVYFLSTPVVNESLDFISLALWILKTSYYMLIAGSLICILFMDLKYRIIANEVIVFGIIVTSFYIVITKVLSLGFYYMSLKSDPFGMYLIKSGFFYNRVLSTLTPLLYTLGISLVLFGFFYFLVFITKGRGMGGGDVKLAFLVGLVSGFPNAIVSVFLAFLTGALVSVILILLGRKRIKGTIPFGPFLVFGTLVGTLWGQQILNWYVKFL